MSFEDKEAKKLYKLFHKLLPIELKLIILDYYRDDYWRNFETKNKTEKNINTFKLINFCEYLIYRSINNFIKKGITMQLINVSPIINQQKTLIMESDPLIFAAYFVDKQPYIDHMKFYMDIMPFAKFIPFININKKLDDIIIEKIKNDKKIYIMDIIGLILLGYTEFYERLKEEISEHKISYEYCSRVEEFKNCYLKYYINQHNDKFTDPNIILERIKYIFEKNVHKNAQLKEGYCNQIRVMTYCNCYLDVLEKIFYYLLCFQANIHKSTDKNVSKLSYPLWDYFNKLCYDFRQFTDTIITNTGDNIHDIRRRIINGIFCNILEKFIKILPWELIKYLIINNDIIADTYFPTYLSTYQPS